MLFRSSEAADFKMRIFNADGSEAMMCGNGIRCVGKYVYDKGYTDKTRLSIETLSGIKTLWLETSGNKVRYATVDMGTVSGQPDMELDISGEKIVCVPVCVGNPHAVIFTPDADRSPVDSLGPLIEKNEAFPDRVNVEFVSPVSTDSIRMRVWERGSGITMACGTGACASAFAAVSKGYFNFEEPISVILDGGILTVTVKKDGRVFMQGPAQTVYEGDVEEC